MKVNNILIIIIVGNTLKKKKEKKKKKSHTWFKSIRKLFVFVFMQMFLGKA